MLSFDSGLSSSLKNAQSVSFWVLKLYYNGEGEQAYQSDGSTANLLAEALDSTETGVDVDYGAAFIAGDFIIIGSEVMEVSSVSSNTLTVIRGSRGTTAATHSDNAVINFDNWIGVSDAYRVDGASDVYHGLVSSWGSYQQSLDFFNFTTSIGNLSISLINAENSIQGGRFSDLLSTNNFANRKWKLFQNTNGLSTFDTAARMIGSGIISGNIEYDQKVVKMVLIDSSSAHHNQIPKNVVDSATYTNAPEKNINKPIPVWYGDFSAISTAADAAKVGFDFGNGTAGNIDHYFTRGKAPSIITDKWDSSAAKVVSKPDSVVLNELSNDNVYMYRNGYYIQTNNGDTSAGSHTAKFKGTAWSVFLPFVTHSTTTNTTDWANTVDGDMETSGKLNAPASSYDATGYWRMPEYNIGDFGTLSSMKLIIFYKNFNPNSSSNVDTFTFANSASVTGNLGFYTGGSDSYAERLALSGNFASAGDVIRVILTANTEVHYVEIRAIGIEINFAPDGESFTKVVTDYHEVTTQDSLTSTEYWDRYGSESVETTKKVARTTSITTPDVGDYVYVGGKGHEYPVWIDTINSAVRTNGNGDAPDPNYNQNALLENGIYIIEDILRRELGLDSGTTGADIDIETFDMAGANQTGTYSATDGPRRGDIAYLFNAATDDIKFAFSQYKFINSKDLITRLCRQCMSFLWFSGSGKFKIRTLLRPTDTWVADETVNYHDIKLKNIRRTSLNSVRNKIVVNYAMDYAKDKMTKTTTSTDTTSNSNALAGYNDTLTLEIDADCIADKTTAENLRDAYLAHYKDRNVIITFDCLIPKYNHLEITDVIGFSNWDTKIKIYGTAMGASDFYMITSIAKNPHGCSIKCMKVN